jgi:hypothetical protein
VNLHKRFAFTLALVAVLGLTAAAASAATVTKATFTLPAQAYWDTTLLPPGDYTLSIERSNSGVDVINLRGEGIAAMFMTAAGSAESSGHSCLKVDDLNGTYVVRGLDAGRSYKFGLSKAVRNLSLRGAAQPPVAIPVSAGM